MDGSKRTFNFAFNDQTIRVEIPENNLVETVSADPVESLKNIEEETIKALAKPIGTKPFNQLAGEKEAVLIAVPDNTRRTDLAPVLSALLSALGWLGFGPGRISIIVAGGTHRAMSDTELTEQWGPVITGQYKFLRHDWNNSSALVNRGRSKQGIPLEFNRELFKGKLLIGLGTVKPHPVAGWSGGAKIILPGLSGKATTDHLHWAAAAYPVESIFGQAENPVRLEMEETVREIGLNLVINAIENKNGDIVSLAAGDFVEAHRFLVEKARSVPLLDLPLEQADVMIVGGGIDRPELWEAMAGLYVANLLLREGGTLILLAACPDGVACEHPAVLEWGYRPYKEIEALVAKNKITDLTAASHMALVGDIISRNKYRVILVSTGINRKETDLLGLEYATDLDQVLEQVWQDHGAQAKILAYERI
jgi:lactate racemase